MRIARPKKRADGRYQKYITVINANGKNKRKCIYARTIKDLEEKTEMVKEQIKADAEHGVTVKEWSSEWYEKYKTNLAYNTRKMYELAINAYILPEIGMIRLAKVGVKDIQNLLYLINVKGHKRTAQILYITLKQMFEQARRLKLIQENPMLDVDRPKYKAQKKRALTKNEVKTIHTASLTLKQKAFTLILLRTGVRVGELLALHRSDLNFQDNELHITKGIHFEKNQPVVDKPKTPAAIRKIPLLEDLLPVLREYALTIDPAKDILFPHKNGGYMTATACRCLWRTIKNKLIASGVVSKDITAHIFRHTFTTELVHSGADIKIIQSIVGHESVAVTLDVYTHADEAAFEDARIRLNQRGVKVDVNGH